MSREVKFRAWHEDLEVMVYSDKRNKSTYDIDYEFVINEKGTLVCNWYEDTEDACGNFREASGTLDNLMQYTGFKDSKGKEIYEGDILHVTKVSMCGVDKYNVAEYNTDVKWEDGAFVIKGDADVEHYDTWLAAYSNPDSPQIEIEVIGNIYENPELLEGKQ